MASKAQKCIFNSLAFLLLAIMIAGSRNAGVSCDEVLHYNHSVSVNNFFSSGGKDRTSLDTPGTHLKYYGQSYDNITTLLADIFNVSNIYGFRHLMASVAGWLAIIISALLAIRLAGPYAGITVLLLFAVSPTFLGHSQNNLKDIPFALGYIAGVFSMIRLLESKQRLPVRESVLLMISISFCMSIRAGGMLLICYLFLFFFINELLKYKQDGKTGITGAAERLALISIISAAAWLLSVLYWPYGLLNPVVNPLRAHLLMSSFPLTFREIFEGSFEWTDYMPWYYLLKYLLITIPVLIIAGLLLFIFRIRRITGHEKLLPWSIVLFSVIFPVVYEIISEPNIYSGWRQFLFIYPGIIIMAAAGITALFPSVRSRIARVIVIGALVILSYHPVKFLLRDYHYGYLYFNELAGGVKGANGYYETDYYFIGQAEAARWLTGYLNKKGYTDTVVVASNFSAEWYFRDMPEVVNIYVRNEERSSYDWDYYLSTNRYILPFRLREGVWPPEDALKVVYAGGAPVCAVIKRKTLADYYGYTALNENRNADAKHFFSEALRFNREDELIFYNFAIALNREGDSLKADSVLDECLRINPFFEPALMYRGMILSRRGDYVQAEKYFRELIRFNRKYFEAYTWLAEAVSKRNMSEARDVLRECLRVNPAYKPAVEALAGLDRSSDPVKAAGFE